MYDIADIAMEDVAEFEDSVEADKLIGSKRLESGLGKNLLLSDLGGSVPHRFKLSDDVELVLNSHNNPHKNHSVRPSYRKHTRL